MIKIKKRHIFHIGMFNMVGQCFEWIKDTSQFNEGFMKTIMKKVIKDILLKLIFSILNIT